MLLVPTAPRLPGRGDDKFYVRPDECCGQFGEAIGLAICPAVLDDGIASFAEAQGPQALTEG